MGDEMPREQLLAERLHLHGVIAKDWRAMSATEQHAIRCVAEEYDEEFREPDLHNELAAAKEEIDELRERLDEIEKAKENRGVALIEGPDGELELTFRGKEIDGVLAATVRWDAKDDTRVSLRLRSLESPVLVDLAADVELTIETSLDDQIALAAKAAGNAVAEGAARKRKGA